jgi:hypothetical protein
MPVFFTEHLMIKKLTFIFAFAFLFAVNANANNLFTLNNTDASLKENLNPFVENPVILKMDFNELKTIYSQKQYSLDLNIPVTEYHSVRVHLNKFDIFDKNAQLVERTASGNKPFQLTNGIVSYTGIIEGMPNSLVVLNFFEDQIIGLLKTENDVYVIGKIGNDSEITDNYIVYQETKKKFHSELKCGSDALGVPESVYESMQQLKARMEQTDSGFDVMLNASVAIDIDFFTHNLYGGTQNATNWATALMTAVSAVYLKDENVKISIGYLRVWTTQDPYTSTSGIAMLNQLRSEWISTQGGVQRVITHLLSRRNNIDVAGIAFLNVLCDNTNGYGLSATLNGQINNIPNYSYDVVVVAHEMGHNFGSPHTHNCSWVGGPLDTCEFVEGGCFSGPPRPAVGTIMSYCDLIGGGSVILDFGEQPGALIRIRAESAPCITNANTNMLVAYPNGGETYRTGQNVAIWWGGSLTGNVNIEYTSNNGSSWNSVQNNVPAQNRTVTWTVPYIATTLQAKIRILDASNPAIGDTTDGTFRIILNLNFINLLSPPTLTKVETAPNNSTVQQFKWSSSGTHPSIRYAFKIRKGGAPPSSNLSYASDNNGIDTVISLRKSFLDTLAQNLGTVNDSVLCIWTAFAYNGFDSTSSSSFIVVLKRTGVGITQISTEIPEKFELGNNYPNPFNPTTKINFAIPKASFTTLKVYDISGKEIATLVSEYTQAGYYNVDFNAANVSSGVYFYRIQSGDFVDTKRMILLK